MYRRLTEIQQRERLSLHVPGHKGKLKELGLFTDLSFDTTELSDTDDLFHPQGMIKEAMDYGANLYRVKQTLFSLGGSTAGLYAGIHSVVKRGDRIFVDRKAHRSVAQIAELLELDPVWFYPEGNPEIPDDVTMVLLVSPDYYGRITDGRPWVKKCEEKGIPLIVDEAHGAHLRFFAPEKSAVAAGAHIVVQSVHKMLPGLTGTALIHGQGDEEALAALRRSHLLFTTSSPSYVLMASIDGSLRWMEEKGRERLEALRKVLPEREDRGDPFKVLLEKPGYSGKELFHALEQQGIRGEFYDEYGVLGIFTAANTPEEVAWLNGILQGLDDRGGELSEKKSSTFTHIPEKVLSPWKALERKRQPVALERCLGRICGEKIVPYPPGIPLIVEGERWDQQVYDELERIREMGRWNDREVSVLEE